MVYCYKKSNINEKEPGYGSFKKPLNWIHPFSATGSDSKSSGGNQDPKKKDKEVIDDENEPGGHTDEPEEDGWSFTEVGPF